MGDWELTPTAAQLLDAALAIGIGMVIGLEREHADVTHVEPDEPPEVVLGVRTFGLLSLFGWASATVGTWFPWFPMAAILPIGGLLGITMLRSHKAGVGLTTEIAALATFVLGMLVRHDRTLAVALALGVTLLLISKPWFRVVVPRLKRMDLTATLQLAILLAIVVPLLPDTPIDPWQALSPRKLGIFVALIAGISWIGYVLNRVVGARRGAGLTGLVGGLASSTAVTVAMAQRARETDAMIVPGQLATMLASTVMCVRVVVVAALVDLGVAQALALPLGAMALCLIAGAAERWLAMRRTKDGAEARELELKNPFSLLPALRWGLLLAAIVVLSAIARDQFGEAGLLVMAGVSGLADVDAINLAATRQAESGAISVGLATLTVTVAAVSNTVVKGGIAWMSGGKAFGGRIAVVFGAAAVVGLALALVFHAA